jgi:hypothetical protein
MRTGQEESRIARLRRWQVWRECLYLCAKQTGVWYVVCATQDVACVESRVESSEVRYVLPTRIALPPSKQAQWRACVLQHEQAWQAATMARRREPGEKEETSDPSTARAYVTQRTATSQPSRNCYTIPIYTNEQDIYLSLLPVSTCSHLHINLIHLLLIYLFVCMRFSPQAMVTSV